MLSCRFTLKGPKPLPAAYPKEIRTLGDHLRKRRLDLGLLQRQVAAKVGVNKGTIVNWECNATTPALRHVPGIIRFLGYAPATKVTSFPDQLKLMRQLSGLSLLRLAGFLGVDEGTVRRWERGRSRPEPKVADRLKALLPGFKSTEEGYEE